MAGLATWLAGQQGWLGWQGWLARAQKFKAGRQWTLITRFLGPYIKQLQTAVRQVDMLQIAGILLLLTGRHVPQPHSRLPLASRGRRIFVAEGPSPGPFHLDLGPGP